MRATFVLLAIAAVALVACEERAEQQPATIAAVAPSDASPSPASEPSEPPSPEPDPRQATVTVVRVIDGDTIDVQIDGTIERVRFILVDTPEVFSGVECYGREASARTVALLPVGSTVTLERDVSERDRFGRLLRYVYLADGRMLNELLVAEGFATVATFPPDLRYLDRFREAESVARAELRGLWSLCAGTPTPGSGGDARAGCDPSYPSVCIPRFPPDLDCGEIPFRRFQVVGSDPHGFDRDRDGVGCES